MKVLITAPSLDEDENVSGISTLVRELVKKHSADYVHFEAGRKDGEPSDAGWMARQFALPFRFLAKLRFERPDIVHLNTAFIPLAIVRDAALAGAARILNVPVLLHIHGGPFVMDEIKNPAIEAAARGLLKMSSAVVVFSKRESDSLAKRFPGTKIHVLPNAVPLDDVIDAERGTGEKTFIFFGRLHESKGIRHIVDACRELKAQGFSFKFVCYGAGSEKEFFTSSMTKMLGDRFSYRGVAKGVAKWKALSEADIFFLPSRDEGLPLALLEAMAAGCVPVMSESGAVADVIDDGRNGFLIEAGNTTQTVGRLKNLISESVLGWNTLRKNARETVRERFDFADYVAKLNKIYKETAAQK
ncbi:MAG: glycosyltransferase family 4 protein [Acidobacteriota bacterium]